MVRKTAERIFYILENQDNPINSSLQEFMEQVDNEGLVSILKGLGQYQTKGRGANRTVWCNPYIWVLLALELHPEIYGKVIIWLTDKLVFNRIEAGLLYRPLTEQIKKVIVPQVAHPVDAYRETAIVINEKVFGKHENGIRNIGTESELRNLAELERSLAMALKMGFVKNAADIKQYVSRWD
jgi:hypothetical protein